MISRFSRQRRFPVALATSRASLVAFSGSWTFACTKVSIQDSGAPYLFLHFSSVVPLAFCFNDRECRNKDTLTGRSIKSVKSSECVFQSSNTSRKLNFNQRHQDLVCFVRCNKTYCSPESAD